MFTRILTGSKSLHPSAHISVLCDGIALICARLRGSHNTFSNVSVLCFLRCSRSRTGHTSWCNQDKITGNQMLYVMNLVPLTDVKILKELVHSFRTWRKIWLWSKRAGVWYDLWPPKLLGSFRGRAKIWRRAVSHTREDALKVLLTEEYMPGALGSLGVL